jgi:dTDP-4-amino-4,6-dideoxygalactose transaminase
VALELLARALGLAGEVIVPAFTFVATAHAFEWLGIRPVFCDVDPETHNLDADKIEPLLTERTSAIVGVHLWGRPCDVDRLAALADRHRLKLIFDAAHAFACSSGGAMVGGFGDAEVFSFHATKFFNTFEGGAITTNDDHLAKNLRLMRNFGFAGYDSVVTVGTNGKMSELSAAMGLTGLESLETFIDTNRRNYQAYAAGLGGLGGVRMTEYRGEDRNNFQYVVFELDEEACGISRDDLVQVLKAEGVLARRYFTPGCHRMEPYRSSEGHVRSPLPVTERLATTVFTLPTGSSISVEMVDRVCDLVRAAVSRGREVSKRLALVRAAIVVGAYPNRSDREGV